MALALAFGLLSALVAQEKPPETVEEGRAPQRALNLDGAPDELRKLIAGFALPDTEFAWKLARKRETAKHVEYELSFPSAVRSAVEENNTVWCKYWVPKDDEKKRPAVLVLHWLGGSFLVLEQVCQKLADRGIATLMMWMPHYGRRRARDREKRQEMIEPDMERTLANFRQAVVDARRAGDWLASRPDVDPARVGLLGISLGAVVGALSAGIDTNLRRVVLMIGGGDLPLVVWNDSKETREIRRKLEEQGHTQEKLRERWREIEPLTYAARLDKAGVLMINAENDQVFPRESTEKLWEAIGRPKLSWYKADHFTIILHLGRILDEMAKHLKS